MHSKSNKSSVKHLQGKKKGESSVQPTYLASLNVGLLICHLLFNQTAQLQVHIHTSPNVSTCLASSAPSARRWENRVQLWGEVHSTGVCTCTHLYLKIPARHPLPNLSRLLFGFFISTLRLKCCSNKFERGLTSLNRNKPTSV